MTPAYPQPAFPEQFARGLSVGSAESCSPHSQPPTLDVESIDDIFSRIDVEGRGHLSLDDMHSVIVAVEHEFGIGLVGDDSKRLLSFLNGGASPSTGVGRADFVRNLEELLRVLQRSHLNVKQLKVAFSAAFDRFDLNSDGVLDGTEFAAGAAMLGLNLNAEDAVRLHRFIATTEDAEIQQDSIADSRPVWERWGSAAGSSVEHMRQRSGLPELEQFLAQIRDALEEEGDPLKKVQRAGQAVWDNVDKLAASAELAVNTTSLTVAAQYIEEGLRDQNLLSEDVRGVAPVLLLLGLAGVNLAKELDELVPKLMSEDEALLYAQVFHGAGFTQTEFRRLLACQGCQWRVAERGETINADSSLKVMIRGTVSVQEKDCPEVTATLKPGTFLGATQLLAGSPLWARQKLTVTQPVTLLEWDVTSLGECLDHHHLLDSKFKNLLADAMTSNLRAVTKLQKKRDAGSTKDKRTASWLERQGQMLDHSFQSASAVKELASVVRASTLILGPEFPKEAERAGLRRDDLQLLLSHFDAGTDLGLGDQDVTRLFAYLDRDGSGEVDADMAVRRLGDLGESLRRLGGISLKQAAASMNLASGGTASAVDGHTFIELSAQLELGLSEQQARAIHEFLDSDRDGVVDLAELAHGASGEMGAHAEEQKSLLWVSTLGDALMASAEKKGLNRLCYLAHCIHNVLSSPGEPLDKAARALKFLWNGTDEMADLMEATLDVSGVLCAAAALWQELSQNADVGLEDELNLAPFLVFLGIVGAHGARSLAKGQVSDLKGPELLAYTCYFEPEGVTVAEFQRLLNQGRGRFLRLEPGEAVPVCTAGQPAPALVVQGRCAPQGLHHMRCVGDAAVSVAAGGFLGEAAFLRAAGGRGGSAERLEAASGTLASEAMEPTLLLAWDSDAVEKCLSHDETLSRKVHRVVTLSLAQRLLRAHDASFSSQPHRDVPSLGASWGSEAGTVAMTEEANSHPDVRLF